MAKQTQTGNEHNLYLTLTNTPPIDRHTRTHTQHTQHAHTPLLPLIVLDKSMDCSLFIWERSLHMIFSPLALFHFILCLVLILSNRNSLPFLVSPPRHLPHLHSPLTPFLPPSTPTDTWHLLTLWHLLKKRKRTQCVYVCVRVSVCSPAVGVSVGWRGVLRECALSGAFCLLSPY